MITKLFIILFCGGSIMLDYLLLLDRLVAFTKT